MRPRPFSYRFAVVLALVMALGSWACRPAADDSDSPSVAGSGAPIVEREVIDGVTQVRNLSGSVWPESARLEEIATIGSDEVEESFFGNPLALGVTDDIVLVADLAYGFVRGFDREGRFLRSYGGKGQGPGEFERVVWAGFLETGQVAVASYHPPRLSIFELDGAHVADWPVPNNDDLRETSRVLISSDGRPFWLTHRVDPEQLRAVSNSGEGGSYRELTAEGWRGEPVPLPWRQVERPAVEYSCPDMEHLGGRCSESLPWAPTFVSVMTPELTALSGMADQYRFEARRRDGSVMVVEHYQQPTRITPLERRIAAASVEAKIRKYVPGYEFDESRLPDHKPAFFSFTRSRDGRLMVVREGESRWDEEHCGALEAWTPERGTSGCLVTEHWIDAFASDGSFIGTFMVPPEAWFGGSFIDGDEIWMQAEDEIGNAVVKGYRIVIPEGGA